MEFNKILVPISGTDADEETIKLACRLAKKDKGRIWAVYVITVQRTLPLDAEIEPEIQRAEDILDQIEMIAEEEDHEVEAEALQAR